MGKTEGRYKEEFPVGSYVRVIDRDALEEFARTWKFHHPLQPHQLESAGATATVASVGFYHGGDELYQLDGIPGTWHEICLRRSDGQQAVAAAERHTHPREGELDASPP